MNDKSRVHRMIAFCALLLGLGYYSTYFLGLGMPELGVQGVRVCVFLLSRLFCCLSFSGVFFWVFGREPVFLFFAVWAGARAPPKQQQQHYPAQTAKNKHAPAPSERLFVLFLLFGRVGVFACFCCLGLVRVFFAVWAGVVFFLTCCLGGGFFFLFCCLGGGRVYLFAVWARVVFFFFFFFVFLFGRGGRGFFFFSFFLIFGRGMGVHSLTGLPGSSSSDPTTKKTKQQKQKKTRVPLTAPSGKSVCFFCCLVCFVV